LVNNSNISWGCRFISNNCNWILSNGIVYSLQPYIPMNEMNILNNNNNQINMNNNNMNNQYFNENDCNNDLNELN
jgi:hypothetical protein